MRDAPLTQYEQIFKSVLKFLRPQTADKKYKMIVAEAVKLTGAKDGSIFLGNNGSLNEGHTTTPHKYHLTLHKKGEVYQAYKSGEPTIIKNTTIKYGLIIPLTSDKKTIGVLVLRSAKKIRLSKANKEKLKFFGAFAGNSIVRTQLLQEMRKALRSRNLFFSYVAHELKTPLTSILIYTHMMEKRHQAKKPIDTKWIHVVKEESKRVQQMIDEFLTVEKYRVQEMKFKKSAVSLSSVIERCLADFYLTSPNNTVLLKNTIKKNDMVLGDFDKLCQVVINLLNNAAKFSNQGSTISIRTYKRSPYYVLSITDEGKGIPKEEMRFIFNAFYKGKTSTGKGIGLHIVKEIVDKHEGKITVHTQKKGTTFEIRIPQYTGEHAKVGKKGVIGYREKYGHALSVVSTPGKNNN